MTGPTLAFPLSSFSAPHPRGYFSWWIDMNQSPSGGRDGGVAHVRTKRARGYWLHISINSSGLASFDVDGGAGFLGSERGSNTPSDRSQLAAWMRGDSEDSEKERIAGRIWVPSCLNESMWQWQCVTSQNEAMAVLRALTAAALYHYLKCCMLSESRCHCSGLIQFLFHCLPLLHIFNSSTHTVFLSLFTWTWICVHVVATSSSRHAVAVQKKCVPPILLVMIDVTASLLPLIKLIFTE